MDAPLLRRSFARGSIQGQKTVENILGSNPEIGHPTEWDRVREFSIPNIPFSVIYRIKEGRIEVLRLWDERRNRDQDIV